MNLNLVGQGTGEKTRTTTLPWRGKANYLARTKRSKQICGDGNGVVLGGGGERCTRRTFKKYTEEVFTPPRRKKRGWGELIPGLEVQ